MCIRDSTIRVDDVDFEVTATPVFGDEKETEIIGGLLRFENITEKLKMDKMLHTDDGETKDYDKPEHFVHITLDADGNAKSERATVKVEG